MRMRCKKWARPELQACPYYVTEPQKNRGHWREQFEKDQPLYLELGCGKGVATTRMVHDNPQINYLALDVSTNMLGVMRRNMEKVFEGAPVKNCLIFAQEVMRIEQTFAPEDRVERIYINFCNPWEQHAKHHKRRLTHTRQLNTYKKVLAPGGELWFKTDNTDLYLATQRYLAEAGFEILCKTDDLHSEDAPGNIQSEHEVMFTAEGIKTKAIIARWNGEPETPERVSTEQAEKVENTAE